MQRTPDHLADPPQEDGRPTGRLELASSRFLLAVVVISELACIALVAALVV